MSICNVCLKELPDYKFGVTRRKLKTGETKTYKDTTCMVCRRKAHLSKPGKREIHRAGALRWRENNPDKIRDQNLRKYGLTTTTYNEMRAAQDYKCAVCGVHESEAPRGRSMSEETSLHVDHKHGGSIRKLLCINCNNLLGKAKDSITILEAAIRYLQNHE